jgi:hypothetical protein
MTSIVITPFNDEHAEELMGFIRNELDNADFEGEDMPAYISLQEVNRNNVQRELFREALQQIETTLRDHPDADRGNSRVHYALMQAKNALNPTTKE